MANCVTGWRYWNAVQHHLQQADSGQSIHIQGLSAKQVWRRPTAGIGTCSVQEPVRSVYDWWNDVMQLFVKLFVVRDYNYWYRC